VKTPKNIAYAKHAIAIADTIYSTPPDGSRANPWVENHLRAVEFLQSALMAIANDCANTHRLLFRYHALAGRLINAEAEERAGLIDELIATWEGISSHD